MIGPNKSYTKSAYIYILYKHCLYDLFGPIIFWYGVKHSRDLSSSRGFNKGSEQLVSVAVRRNAGTLIWCVFCDSTQAGQKNNNNT